MNKEDEEKVIAVVEDCRLYRNSFIVKSELIRKLEEAFPEVKKITKERKKGEHLW